MANFRNFDFSKIDFPQNYRKFRKFDATTVFIEQKYILETYFDFQNGFFRPEKSKNVIFVDLIILWIMKKGPEHDWRLGNRRKWILRGSRTVNCGKFFPMNFFEISNFSKNIFANLVKNQFFPNFFFVIQLVF